MLIIKDLGKRENLKNSKSSLLNKDKFLLIKIVTLCNILRFITKKPRHNNGVYFLQIHLKRTIIISMKALDFSTDYYYSRMYPLFFYNNLLQHEFNVAIIYLKKYRTCTKNFQFWTIFYEKTGANSGFLN